MKTFRAHAAAAAIVIVLSAAPAAAQGLAQVCREPSDADVLYVIDAATGEAEKVARFKKSNTLVRVYVRNPNPFRYTYTLTSKNTAVAEPTGADLLAHVTLLPVTPKAPAKPETPGAPNVSAATAKTSNETWAMIAALKAAATAGERIETARAAADAALHEAEQKIRDLGEKATMTQAVLGQPAAMCEELLGAATELFTAADAVDPNLDATADLIEEYRKSLSVGLPAGTDDVYPAFVKRLQAARETHTKLMTVARGVKTVAHGAGFFKSLYVGDFNQPTDVTITLSRKELADEKAPVEELHTRTLNFGGRGRFSTSAGWAVSSLRRQTFARAQGHPRAASSAAADVTQIVPIVGLDEDSAQRNGPLALVNVRLKTWDDVSLHWSFGATPKSDDDKLSAEYLTGPSVAFAEDRFFATLGVYLGRQEKLADGFFVGEAVPESVTTVPVTRKLTAGLGIAITYKLR